MRKPLKVFVSGTISPRTLKKNKSIAKLLGSSPQVRVVLPQEFSEKHEKELYNLNLRELVASDVLFLLGDTFGICSSTEVGRAKAMNKPVVFFAERESSLIRLARHLMVKYDVDAIVTTKPRVFQLAKATKTLATKEIVLTTSSHLGHELAILMSHIR